MKTLKRKTRAEAFEQKLSAEQLSQLRSWCNVQGFVQAIETARRAFGLTVSKSALARWYHKDDEELILGTIASGAAMNRQITAAYEENPAPEMTTLVSLIKTLVMQLSVQGAADPSMLELANQLFKSSLDYLKEQGKSEDRKLEREKYQRETAGFFMKWYEDQRAKDIANAPISNDEKTDLLGKLMFGEDWK